MSARVLLFDIENAPAEVYVWGDSKYEQNVIEVKTPWYLLSIAYQWADETKIHTLALPDFPGYDPVTADDRKLAASIWDLFDQADVVVAHNGDRHDVRKCRARFAFHGLPPPSPFKQIDTLKIARKHFAFTSNSLDDLGLYLQCGRKLPHTGFHLWRSCMAGDPKAWSKMLRYNANDVALLRRVFYKLRPYATNHPNLTFFTGQTDDCPVCQSSHTKASGFAYVRTGKRQRRACLDCGHRYQCGGLVK